MSESTATALFLSAICLVTGILIGMWVQWFAGHSFAVYH